MEKAERDFLLQYLAATRERMLETVDGFSKEQQRFRPGEGRWSIADCLEHVAMVERAILKAVQTVLQQPPQPELRAEISDGEMLTRAVQRWPRSVCPPEFEPLRQWSDFSQLIRQFEAARERSLRFAGVTQADLRSHFFPHPQFGQMDGYQWMLLLGAHCERHARQAEEVAADPKFPRESDSATA